MFNISRALGHVHDFQGAMLNISEVMLKFQGGMFNMTRVSGILKETHLLSRGDSICQ